MKYMDKALQGSAGIVDHIEKLERYLSDNNNLAAIKAEMKEVFNQKLQLGLVDNQNPICSFSDRNPEYIFVFANHDPQSKILYTQLCAVKQYIATHALPFDLKFATSTFFGYGLYNQSIYDLDHFMDKFARQI